MSYEYKESMKEDLQHLYEIPTGVWKYKEKLEELDEVYAQAAKADEYEAKAKAFDRIVEQRKKTGVTTLGHHAWEIIREYESGELELTLKKKSY